MSFVPSTSPGISLGIIPAPDQTAAVCLNINLPANDDGRFNSIEMEAVQNVEKDPNQDVVYIGGADVDPASPGTVLKTLSPGEQWALGDSKMGNFIDIHKLFVRAKQGGADGVMARGVRK